MAKRVLIIDDIDQNEKFYDELPNDPLLKNVELLILDNAAKAISAIQQDANNFYAVFVSPTVESPGSLSIIKISLMHQPLIPIYYIESMSSGLQPSPEDKSLALSGSIARPFSGKELISKISDQLSFYDSNQALKVAEQNKDKVDDILDETDPAFTSISLEHYLSGSKSLFDIYVKMRQDKYIKILQAGDKFDKERIDQYIEKNVKHLYIRKEAQEEYVKYCDRLNAAILKNPEVDLSKKFGYLFNQAEVTINRLCQLGVDNDNVVHAQRYVKKTTMLVNNMAQKDDVIKSLISNLEHFEHSTSVLVFASMITKAMELENQSTHETLGFACMMHDIGFTKEDNEEVDYKSMGKTTYKREEDVLERLASGKCFGAEKTKLEKVCLEHPQIAQDLLSESDNVSSLALQIIRQHHAIRDKAKGKYTGGAVHPLASVLELSDEVIHYLASKSSKISDSTKIYMDLMELGTKYPGTISRAFAKTLEAAGEVE